MASYLQLNGATESTKSHRIEEKNASNTLEEDKSMPIAIVGMGFRGPADATSVENLWKMISEGREGRSEIPKDRWNNEAFYHPNSARNGTVSPASVCKELQGALNDHWRSIMWKQVIL